MTNKEIINRNIGLTFDLIHKIIDDPSLINDFPKHCEIEFIEKDFPLTKKDYPKKSKLIKVKNDLELV
jgi:hypothetical protein